MQKRASKLGLLALGIVSVVTQATNASNMSYLIKAGVGYNWLVAKLSQTTKHMRKLDDKTYEGNWLRYSELETINKNGLDIAAGAYAINRVTDFFGMGGGLELGYSFSQDQAKDWKALSLYDGFFAKLGIALTMTDWFMLHFGVRMSNLTLGYAKSDDSDNSKHTMKLDLYADPTKDSKASAFAWGLFADASLLIPITDCIRLALTFGVFGDLNSPEFEKIGKKGKGSIETGKTLMFTRKGTLDGTDTDGAVVTYEDSDGEMRNAQAKADVQVPEADLTDTEKRALKAANNSLEEYDTNVSIHKRIAMRFGVSVGFTF